MKKTRLLITLLVMLVAASGYAQDSYREAVKQFVSANGQIDRMKSAFTTLNETFFKKTEGVDLNALTERYVKECLDDQVTDMVMPMMKERNLTEADLRTVSALLSTPEGKAFTDHQNEWNTELPTAMVGVMFEQAELLEDEGVVEKIAVNPDIPKSYETKFRNMMEVGKVKDMLLGFLDGFSEGAPNMPDKYKKWLEENFVTIALNCAYGIMTPEDIDYGTKLYSNESYLKTQDISGMKVADLQSTGVGLMSGYIDWMQAQGAQLSGTASLMKSMLEKKD